MKYGMISTGSKEASEAAQEILKLGGNAFDASIAAVMTSMTSEVNLTSMAVGGAMLEYKKGQKHPPPNRQSGIYFVGYLCVFVFV